VYLFIGYILGKALTLNKKAKITEYGTMILELQKGFRIIGIAFLMFAAFLLFQADSEFAITDFMSFFIMAILILFFLILGTCVIVSSFDVVEVSSEKIRNYNILGIGKEKVISWERIDDIRYDEFNIGIKIVSNKTKINIDIERSGFEDFIALLRTRYGDTIHGVSFDDICTDIKKFKKFPIT
jgi:hypothetical protein